MSSLSVAGVAVFALAVDVVWAFEFVVPVLD
jgi:hypothetical protein